ncbi:hypothetical protein [Actinoplanes sp. M2I2]|uniref:hypothetical protein n=1 Tax=Actinoplanes sp. M2I2 TaxID=1734444 RepID=UPI0020203511|nr:hypothetical protein [Actinoplanes sp. M2I2]
MPWWPFPDERAFWQWAMDPYAELMDQDEDLLLYDIAGFNLLIAAVGWSDCPKRDVCRVALEDFTRLIAWRRSPEEIGALRAAAIRAARQQHPLVLRWATYAQRLLSYQQSVGPVNRSTATTMATELLATPTARERDEPGWLTVQAIEKGRLWQCHRRFEPSHLYINRRTGAWRICSPQLATAQFFAAL